MPPAPLYTFLYVDVIDFALPLLLMQSNKVAGLH